MTPKVPRSDGRLKDQRIVLRYFLFSLAFGMAMGLIFPVYAGFFVDFKSPTHQVIFLAGCIVAGVVVGMASFLIGRFTLLRVVRTISRRFGELSESDGDLSSDVELRSSDDLGDLVNNFNRFQNKLRQMIGQLAVLAEQVQLDSSSLGAAAQQSSSALEQMSATTAQVARFADSQQEQTAAAGRDMEAMVGQISQSNELTQGIATQFFLFTQAMEASRRRLQSTASEARTAEQVSENLNQISEEGERTLESLRLSIGGVVRQADEIQNIATVILDIADRTNLLSMNAAIEAAHAGHSGRGFAVVADEIRKLADTSSRQAQSIKSLVDAIAEASEQTLRRSETTGQSFQSLRSTVIAVRTATQSIAGQIVQQESEDRALSHGLEEFSRFYSNLSASMDAQVDQSRNVREVLQQLEQTSREIRQSMAEQRLGMEQASGVGVQVRDTAGQLGAVVEGLTEQTKKFRLAR